MKIDGIELLNSHQDMVAKSILNGAWEDYSRIVWRDCVNGLAAGSVVWDVGAYTGYYAMVAAKNRPDINVVAFEPHPTIFAALSDNIRHNNISNICCLNLALGKNIGRATINVTNNIKLPSGSSLVDIGKPIVNSIPVMVVHGDSIPLDVEAMPKLIKIDVEEYEIDVLEGMSNILANAKPTLLIEILIEEKVAFVERILKPFGYTISRINENGANFSAPFSPSDRNYLCCANQSL